MELFKSVLIKMDFDEVCFQRSEMEDYNVEDLVKQPDSVVKHLIEYRKCPGQVYTCECVYTSIYLSVIHVSVCIHPSIYLSVHQQLIHLQ